MRPKAYVQDFPRNTTNEQLRRALSEYGPVVEIQKSKNKGKKAKPYAVVSLRSRKDLETLLKARVEMKGQLLLIKVYKTEEELKAERHAEIQKRIFVNNLPSHIVKDDVYAAVSEFGAVLSIKMSQKAGSVTARVTFGNKRARDECLTKGTLLVGGVESLAEQQRVYDMLACDKVPSLNKKSPSEAQSNRNASERSIIIEQTWRGGPSDWQAGIEHTAFREEKKNRYPSTRSFGNFSTVESLPRVGFGRSKEFLTLEPHQNKKPVAQFRPLITKNLAKIGEYSVSRNEGKKVDPKVKFDWFGFPISGGFRTKDLLTKESGQLVSFDTSIYRFNREIETRRERRVAGTRVMKPFLGLAHNNQPHAQFCIRYLSRYSHF